MLSSNDQRNNLITAIGLGGGGCNVINGIISAEEIPHVRYIGLNTDAQDLDNCLAPEKLQLGIKTCGGLGAQASPRLGKSAFQESKREVGLLINQMSLYCIIASLGGGTGSGAIIDLAQLIIKKGYPVTVIVTIPFQFEGRARARRADQTLKTLRRILNYPIVFENDMLLRTTDIGTTFSQTFQQMNMICSYFLQEVLHALIDEPFQSTALDYHSELIFWAKEALELAVPDILEKFPKREREDIRSFVLLSEDNFQLLEALTLDAESIRAITPRKFEELLSYIYRLVGSRVELTPQTRDQGADLLVYTPAPLFGKDFLTIVQAKKYDGRRKVGSPEIRDLAGSQYIFHANRAQCITTTGYTIPAIQTAKKSDIDLGLFSDLLKIVQNHLTIK